MDGNGMATTLDEVIDEAVDCGLLQLSTNRTKREGRSCRTHVAQTPAGRGHVSGS
jgi:hypothetical protein